MNPLKVFVLSLSDATERRKSASFQCARYNLPFEWFDALDFRNKSRIEIINHYQPTQRAQKKNKLLSNTEIACALSHQKIYQSIITEKNPFSLILEDDFSFINDPIPLINNLGTIQKNTNFDVLILGYVKILSKDLSYHYRRLPIKKIYSQVNYNFGEPWEQFSCGTVGYIITLNGARKLSSEVVNVTADDWLYFKIKKNVSILHVRPLIVLEDCKNFPSSIRTEKSDYLKIKPSSYIIRSVKGSIKNLIMNRLK